MQDLDRAIPPIEIDQDLDVTYDRLYCGKTTLQDSDLNINQYPVAFLNHNLVPVFRAEPEKKNNSILPKMVLIFRWEHVYFLDST